MKDLREGLATMKWLLALLLFIPEVSAAGEDRTSTRLALDRAVPALLATSAVPGVSIAQIHHRRVVLTAAYGVQSKGVPATTRSLYNIASLTKPLTAEIILRLASARAFTLDEPMHVAWTDPDIAGDERTKLLTPRLALSHQTGFPNWRDRKTGLKFLRSPGQAIGYSGEGYDYVARFAEKKTGRAFEALAQERLFGPLGMQDTSYIGQPWFDGRIAEPTNAAGASLKPLVRTRFSAADVVYTTATDYAAFMVNVLKDKGLSRKVARERGRIQVSMKTETCKGSKAVTCPADIGFGLGWQILVFDKETILMHTGKDDGVFTFAYLNKTTGDGAVVLTNSDNGAKLVAPILEVLAASPAYVRFLRGQQR